MRTIILLASAFALVSCGTDQAATDQGVTEENDGTEFTVANDITAIDAATGEAANMAADIEYTANDADEAAANTASGNTANGGD